MTRTRPHPRRPDLTNEIEAREARALPLRGVCMPATELFLVVAVAVGAGIFGLIAWVTARRASVGRRLELQLQARRGAGTRRARAGIEP